MYPYYSLLLATTNKFFKQQKQLILIFGLAVLFKHALHDELATFDPIKVNNVPCGVFKQYKDSYLKQTYGSALK
jgi:hypothetical protein